MEFIEHGGPTDPQEGARRYINGAPYVYLGLWHEGEQFERFGWYAVDSLVPHEARSFVGGAG
jgi:hypothetical protein